MEELLQFLYLTPVGIVKFRANGKIDLINPRAASILMPIAPDRALGNIFGALGTLAPDLRGRVTAFEPEVGVIVDQQSLEATFEDHVQILSLTVSRVNERSFMAIINDVTIAEMQKRVLLSERQKLRAIFDHVHECAIYTVSLDGVIDEWNPSLEHYAGWLASDVEGRCMSLLMSSDESPQFPVTALLAEARRAGAAETEGWRMKRDGSRFWGNTVVTAMPDDAGAVRGFVVVSRDMTERKRTEDDMRRLASVDPLTGAWNRRQGAILLAAEESRRSRDDHAFSILMIDIDHFKAVNDRFGHAGGDEVLRALVRSCHDELRVADMIVRWGGEEFLVILPGADADAASLTAERLRKSLAALRISGPDDARISFTVSIGAAVAADGVDVDGLVRRADLALYKAKTGGRDRAVMST
jgi:diguanylate cyclase (GGDEF)-like protein/PAS domain S-box-containing protein